MATIVSVHSFRGGTGKSNTTANLAAALAAEGKRVGVVDTDIQSPGIHVLFGLDESRISHSLNDYLWGRCDITEAAHDVTPPGLSGKIHLIPSSLRPGEIARILREGYEVALLNDGFRRVIEALQLDVLLIDTHPGLNEETLLSIAISDALIVVLRPDQQDYLGTGVTLEVARRLEVPRILLVVNKVPAALSARDVARRAEQTYGVDVAAVLPHSDELMLLGSSAVFSLAHPDHPISDLFGRIAARMLA